MHTKIMIFSLFCMILLNTASQKEIQSTGDTGYLNMCSTKTKQNLFFWNTLLVISPCQIICLLVSLLCCWPAGTSLFPLHYAVFPSPSVFFFFICLFVSMLCSWPVGTSLQYAVFLSSVFVWYVFLFFSLFVWFVCLFVCLFQYCFADLLAHLCSPCTRLHLPPCPQSVLGSLLQTVCPRACSGEGAVQVNCTHYTS